MTTLPRRETMPRMRLRLTLVAFCASATVLVAQADLLKKQLGALTRTNAYRRGAGLPELTSNDLLNQAAQGHAEYLDKNNFMGHTQDKAKPAFTGEDPAVRATTAGYKWMVIMENVTGDVEPTRGVDSVIASVYHRLPFINHEVREAGFGFSAKAMVMLFAATMRTEARAAAVVCPGDGTIAVPPAWTAQEFPNPLPPDMKLPVGCPVSISFPAAGTIEVVSATLENAATVKQDCLLLTPPTDPHKLLKTEAFLIPRKPLDARNTYRATFQMRVDGALQAKTWFFVTANK